MILLGRYGDRTAARVGRGVGAALGSWRDHRLAFVPSTPLLVPVVASGARAELDGLRAACDVAVRRALAARRSASSCSARGADARARLRHWVVGAGSGSTLDVPLDPALHGVASLPLSSRSAPGCSAASAGPATAPPSSSPPTPTWPARRGGAPLAADSTPHRVCSSSPTDRRRAPRRHPRRCTRCRSLRPRGRWALAAGDPAAAGRPRPRPRRAVSSAGWPAWHVAACAARVSAYAAELHADEAPTASG